MNEIMENLHQYVPNKSVGFSREIAENYLFGGDQLTCAQDLATAVERMEGLVPVVEDWHTKMCLFDVRC